MSSGVSRVTMSLPAGVVSDLDLVCDRLGLSRSAFVSGLLVGVMPRYVKACGGLTSSERSARRYTEASQGDIQDVIDLLQFGGIEVQGDLFTK